MKYIPFVLVFFLSSCSLGNNIQVIYRECGATSEDVSIYLYCYDSGQPYIRKDNTLYIQGCGEVKNVCNVYYYPYDTPAK